MHRTGSCGPSAPRVARPARSPLSEEPTRCLSRAQGPSIRSSSAWPTTSPRPPASGGPPSGSPTTTSASAARKSGVKETPRTIATKLLKPLQAACLEHNLPDLSALVIQKPKARSDFGNLLRPADGWWEPYVDARRGHRRRRRLLVQAVPGRPRLRRLARDRLLLRNDPGRPCRAGNAGDDRISELVRRAWPVFREAARMRRTISYSELAGRAGRSRPTPASPVAQRPVGRCRRAHARPVRPSRPQGQRAARRGWYGLAERGDSDRRWAEAVEACFAPPGRMSPIRDCWSTRTRRLDAHNPGSHSRVPIRQTSDRRRPT